MGPIFSRPSRREIIYRDNPELIKRLAQIENELQKATVQNRQELERQARQMQTQINEERSASEKKIKQYEENHKELQAELLELQQQMDKMEIKSLAQLEEFDSQRFEQLIALCQRVEPAPVVSKHNVGFFGIISTGKSFLINSAIGEEVCKTGPGEVTKEPCPYRSSVAGSDVTFWDLPGRNDELSYYTTTFMGLVKSMDSVGIVITESIKMMTEVTKLLDRLGLDYFYIRNKIDMVEAEELEQTKQQLEREIRETGKHHDIYYVSAKYPTHKHSQDSWVALMDRLTMT